MFQPIDPIVIEAFVLAEADLLIWTNMSGRLD
jgi:hypothetical protein